MKLREAESALGTATTSNLQRLARKLNLRTGTCWRAFFKKCSAPLVHMICLEKERSHSYLSALYRAIGNCDCDCDRSLSRPLLSRDRFFHLRNGPAIALFYGICFFVLGYSFLCVFLTCTSRLIIQQVVSSKYYY